MTATLRNRQTRHCCVKGCPNQPQKGRKTCGCHGKRRAALTVKTSPIKIDRVLNSFREIAADSPVTSVKPLPTERLYIAGIACRTDGSLLGLPTNRPELVDLLDEWLKRPGCTLAVIERETPRRLTSTASIVAAAAQLVKADISSPAVFA